MKSTVRHVSAVATLAVFALLAAGSSKKGGDSAEGGAASTSSGGSIKQSCNQVASMGRCTEYPEGLTFALAEGACNMVPDSGVWGKDRCPTDKVVGKCVDGTKDAFYKNETEFYYAPEFTTESAKKDCVDEALTKGKTFTAGDFKPKADEARGSCTRKLIGSTRTTPDNCEEWPYATSTESWDVLKMNCSGTGDTLVVGKGCTEEQKSGAASKCVEKNGTVVFNFPPDARNAKDFCESPPSSGTYTKLKAAAAAAPAKPGKR